MYREHSRLHLRAAVREFEKETALADSPIPEDGEGRHSACHEALAQGDFEGCDLTCAPDEIGRSGRETGLRQHCSQPQATQTRQLRTLRALSLGGPQDRQT